MLKNRFRLSIRQYGFTLVELLVVMGLAAILFMLSSVNLTNLLPKASITGAEEVIIADLKYQQQKAMIGETEGRGTTDRYGIHFEGSKYILFHGDTFSSSDLANAEQDLGSAVTLTTTFSDNSVVFEKGSGEVVGFVDGMDTISITHSVGAQQVIELNRLGVVVGD